MIIRNGRLVKQIFIGSVEGPKEGFIDCGPAPELTRTDRALSVMDYFERRDRTDCRWYSPAGRTARNSLLGI